MPTPTQINATTQFNQFVEFARLAERAGNKKAIAREGVPFLSKDGTTTLRTVGTASDDKVYAIRRSPDNKQANDAARTLFKKAVGDMFGGDIPPSVLKAMEMKNYGSGKPLTARRIMAVKTAIDSLHMEPVIKSITPQVAAAKVAHAAAFANTEDIKINSPYVIPVTISQPQQQQAADLLRKYGKNMTDAGLNVLAANLVRVVTTPSLAEYADYYAARIAKDIASRRNFEPGDARMKKLDATLFNYVENVVEEYLPMPDINPRTKKPAFQGGLSTAFVSDGPRGTYTIAGRKFIKCTTTDMVDAFKSVVTNPKHRKILSLVMSQALSSIPTGIAYQMPLTETNNLPNGIAAHTVKGAELVVGHSSQDEFYSGQFGVDFNTDSEHELEISPDGKTAKITSKLAGRLKFDLSNDGAVAMTSVGLFSITQEFTFDLSADTPKLLDYHLGQTFGV